MDKPKINGWKDITLLSFCCNSRKDIQDTFIHFSIPIPFVFENRTPTYTHHAFFHLFFLLFTQTSTTHTQERNRTKEKQRVRGGDTCQKTTLNFIAGLCYMFALCIVHFCLVCLLFVRFFPFFVYFEAEETGNARKWYKNFPFNII